MRAKYSPLRDLMTLAVLCGVQMLPASGVAEGEAKPNVLFIAIDDLNDWVGCMGGNPQAITPNIDRLAASGVKFVNAHCDSPACGPSRAALLTGIRPNRSGAYTNNHKIIMRSPVLRAATLLPQLFRENGYHVAGTGKIHHERWLEYIGVADAWDEYWPSKKDGIPYSPWPRHEDGSPHPMRGGPRDEVDLRFKDFDWYPLTCDLSEMAEVKSAGWIRQQLQQPHDKPFFLACGFQKPHVPWYVPKQFFKLHPLDEIQLPEIKEGDLSDIPPIAAAHAWCHNGLHKFIKDNGLWKEAIQGYLAASSYSDYCVGLVLDALEESPYRDNTIVVLWSDHGFHLGEKHKWQKFSLWNEATRCLLMWKVPGLTAPEGSTSVPANLSDMYPTLMELCGLSQPKQKLDGMSLVPFLKDPSKKSKRPALTAHFYKCYSLRTETWRYSQYEDGSEELYDESRDPMEWTNLAQNPEVASVKESLKKWLPAESVPALERIPIVPPGK